jgi:hypothetical protein
MILKTTSLLAFAALALGPAAFADEHGGAIPHNFSFYESAEFPDIQWATGREAQPAWGSLVLEGADGVRFVPDNGLEVKFAYSDIKAIKYERVVKPKEKNGNQKWFQRSMAFAKGVDTYRMITIVHQGGESRASSTVRVDEESAAGIIRLLEIKTGLRAKRLSAI